MLWLSSPIDLASQFDKNSMQESLSSYDYNSIMHYGAYAFSSNGKKTIVPISNPSAAIGQREGLSANDIIEINALYDCQSELIHDEQKFKKNKFEDLGQTSFSIKFWIIFSFQFQTQSKLYQHERHDWL